jgi:ribosomal protein L40E
MWKCKNCGEELENSFDSCWRCGTSKDGVAQAKLQEFESMKEDAAKSNSIKEEVNICKEGFNNNNICPKCQIENPSIAKFCMECGYNIQGIICDKCNAKNAINAKYCIECGNTFQNQPNNQQEHILKVRSYGISKISPPDDVKKRVGYTWLHTSNIYPPIGYDWLKYLHGIKNDDGMALEPGVGSVHLQVHNLGLLINIQTNKTFWIGLNYSEIKEITIEKGDNMQQGGNVAGGALLGGILLGPLGAVIGGLSKAGAKTVATNLLVIKHKLDNKNEGVLIFSMGHGGKQGVHDFLKKYLSKYYKVQ